MATPVAERSIETIPDTMQALVLTGVNDASEEVLADYAVKYVVGSGHFSKTYSSEIDGFLVKSLAEACDAVASLDKIDRAACRKRAEQCFSIPVIAAQYERLYKERMATVQ